MIGLTGPGAPWGSIWGQIGATGRSPGLKGLPVSTSLVLGLAGAGFGFTNVLIEILSWILDLDKPAKISDHYRVRK